MNSTLPLRNGQAKTAQPMPTTQRKPAARPVASAVTAARIKFYATVTMGVLLPLLSLGLSNVGGNLFRAGHAALAVFALSLMACVLIVSLSHLAWAVGDITRSPRWACWLLAIAFDLLLVLGELCHVTAEDAGVGLVTTAIMSALAVVSMFLNVWAFLRHP